jgi:hypothetical protein
MVGKGDGKRVLYRHVWLSVSVCGWRGRDEVGGTHSIPDLLNLGWQSRLGSTSKFGKSLSLSISEQEQQGKRQYCGANVSGCVADRWLGNRAQIGSTDFQLDWSLWMLWSGRVYEYFHAVLCMITAELACLVYGKRLEEMVRTRNGPNRIGT